MNISPSNIFPNRLLNKGFHQNHQAVLAAMSINGLSIIGPDNSFQGALQVRMG